MAQSKPTLPPWIWLLTGVAAGFFLALLVYLSGIQLDKNDREAIQLDNQPPTQAAPKFDFYTLLPDRELVAPDNKPESSSTPEKHPQPTSRSMIQAGSFRSAQEASQLRAELILLGLDVQVQTVQLKAGEHWHRVQIGPFANKAELNNALKTLSDNQVEHIVLRLKKP